MAFQNSYSDAVKPLLACQLNAPPVAIVAFAMLAQDGTLVAYVDPVTKKLVNASGIALASQQATQVLAAASGAIAIATSTVLITKTGSLAALTLAAPTTAQNGITLKVISQTAFAHTITATSLINDGATGAPHTTATFAVFAGASIELQAYNGLWNVVALNAVTIS